MKIRRYGCVKAASGSSSKAVVIFERTVPEDGDEVGKLSIVIHTSEAGNYFSPNYDTTKSKNTAQGY